MREIPCRQDGEFLFEQNGKRIRGNAFNKHLSRICEKLDIPHRTMHKIRKTYGTTLIDNHVDERFITEQMGKSITIPIKKSMYRKSMENNMLDELKEDLVGIDIRFDEPLKRYTYTKVGGPADYLAFPRNRYELSRIVKFANKHDIPWMVLGNASNLIVRDGGIRGFVIMFDRLNGIAVNGYQIEAEAGANLIATTKVARFQSLTGFEFAAGIPGSVGGAVFMNAGAYGGEIAHILVSAQVLTKDGDIRTIDARDMRFGYRRSVLQETGEVVISAKFNLKPGDYEQIKNEMNRLNHLRELKQPLEYPSCGSVFKRPPGHFAGQLIMEANLKGHRIGGVEVSTKHAGFMVNVDHGTAKDYEDLIADVIAKVKENSGVTLEPEVRIIGDKLN